MESVPEEPQNDGAESAPATNNTTNQRQRGPPPAAESSKKSKREDRAKNDRYVEQFLKTVKAAPTVEEKVNQACLMYAHMVDDNKKLQFFIKQSEKRHMLQMKEKDQLQHEYNKAVLVKSKLENLCRELQKQNKAIKEESLHKIREEEERRKETQAKFQNTLSEITALLQQNNEKNAKLRDDNISMTEKFKSVVQQYQLREEQVDKMAKQMALEQQLADAKMQKAALEHQAEKERLLAEMEQLKITVAQYRSKIVELQGTETGLRGQLAVYTDKYDEFQNALVKSNQVFGGFKEEMEKMSKKIKKLEKESLSWKKRWETSQSALLEMCGEQQANEAKAAAANRQLAHMQSLCRTLQAERTLLLGALKENNIERPPLPSPPPAPAPPEPVTTAAALQHQPASNAKVDAMAANCAQLRQSLAHLQSQLNVLTNKQNEEQQPPPKQDKPKKSKSKKSKSQKKETEIDSTKTANENELTVNKDMVDIVDDKVDDDTLDNLIQAINSANINLSDLEVGDDKIEEVLNVDSEEISSSDATISGDVKSDSTPEGETADVTPTDVDTDVKSDVASNDVPSGSAKTVKDVNDKEIPKSDDKVKKELTNTEIKTDSQVNGA